METHVISPSRKACSSVSVCVDAVGAGVPDASHVSHPASPQPLKQLEQKTISHVTGTSPASHETSQLDVYNFVCTESSGHSRIAQDGSVSAGTVEDEHDRASKGADSCRGDSTAWSKQGRDALTGHQPSPGRSSRNHFSSLSQGRDAEVSGHDEAAAPGCVRGAPCGVQSEGTQGRSPGEASGLAGEQRRADDDDGLWTIPPPELPGDAGQRSRLHRLGHGRVRGRPSCSHLADEAVCGLVGSYAGHVQGQARRDHETLSPSRRECGAECRQLHQVVANDGAEQSDDLSQNSNDHKATEHDQFIRPLDDKTADWLEHRSKDILPQAWHSLLATERAIGLEVGCSPKSILGETMEKLCSSDFERKTTEKDSITPWVRCSHWNGCDLTTSTGIQTTKDAISHHRPIHVWISTECGPFSPIQNSNQRNEQQIANLMEKQKIAETQYLGALEVAKHASFLGCALGME